MMQLAAYLRDRIPGLADSLFIVRDVLKTAGHAEVLAGEMGLVRSGEQGSRPAHLVVGNTRLSDMQKVVLFQSLLDCADHLGLNAGFAEGAEVRHAIKNDPVFRSFCSEWLAIPVPPAEFSPEPLGEEQRIDQLNEILLTFLDSYLDPAWQAISDLCNTRRFDEAYSPLFTLFSWPGMEPPAFPNARDLEAQRWARQMLLVIERVQLLMEHDRKALPFWFYAGGYEKDWFSYFEDQWDERAMFSTLTRVLLGPAAGNMGQYILDVLTALRLDARETKSDDGFSAEIEFVKLAHGQSLHSSPFIQEFLERLEAERRRRSKSSADA